jgi:hypothetical protein
LEVPPPENCCVLGGKAEVWGLCGAALTTTTASGKKKGGAQSFFRYIKQKQFSDPTPRNFKF